MTITLDTWQPILVAIIGAIAALAVPVVSAVLASRTAKKAANAATSAANTAAEIGGKVDQLNTTATAHTAKLNEIGRAVNGDRDAARAKIAELEQRLFDRDNPDVKGFSAGTNES